MIVNMFIWSIANVNTSSEAYKFICLGSLTETEVYWNLIEEF
jgi:hypothetical protein